MKQIDLKYQEYFKEEEGKMSTEEEDQFRILHTQPYRTLTLILILMPIKVVNLAVTETPSQEAT